MNELTEQAKDGKSVGEFNDSLTGLIGAIPSSSPTMQKEENPLDIKEEEDVEDPLKDVPEPPKEKKGEEPKEEEQEEQDDDDGDDDNGDDEPNIIDDLASEFGEVDFGEETEFESEGQAAKVYVKKLLESKGKDIGKQAIQGLFQQMPEVGALVEHLSQGYGLESFLKEKQPENYNPIDIDEADDTQKEAIIRTAWKMRGMDDDEIEDALEVARDSGKLDTRAVTAQNYLKKKHEEEVEKVKKEEAEEVKRQEKKNEEVKQQLDSFLDSGKLIGGAVVLDKDKTKTLKEFIFSTTKDGKSVRNEAWNNLPIDKQLVLDYLVATDFKDLKLSSDPVKSKISKNIKIKKTGNSRVKIDNPSGAGGGGKAPFNVKNFFNDVNQ